MGSDITTEITIEGVSWSPISGIDDIRIIESNNNAKCIESSPDPNSNASNTCCYDLSNKRLLTRGPHAGSPSLISKNVDADLHHKYDILPYLHCSQNWAEYHKFRQPNNGNRCMQLPLYDEYRKLKAKLGKD